MFPGCSAAPLTSRVTGVDGDGRWRTERVQERDTNAFHAKSNALDAQGGYIMASASAAHLLDDPLAYLAPGADTITSRPDVGTVDASDQMQWTGSGEYIVSWAAKVRSPAIPASLPAPFSRSML